MYSHVNYGVLAICVLFTFPQVSSLPSFLWRPSAPPSHLDVSPPSRILPLSPPWPQGYHTPDAWIGLHSAIPPHWLAYSTIDGRNHYFAVILHVNEDLPVAMRPQETVWAKLKPHELSCLQHNLYLCIAYSRICRPKRHTSHCRPRDKYILYLSSFHIKNIRVVTLSHTSSPQPLATMSNSRFS